MTRNEVYDPHDRQPQYKSGAFAMNDFLNDQFNLLEATFRGTISEPTRATWITRLEKLPTAALRRGFRGICDEQDKMPSLAQILRFARREIQQGGAPYYPEAVDKNGVKCWVDESTGDLLYMAKDCPEGQAFLAMFTEKFGPLTRPEKFLSRRHHAGLIASANQTAKSKIAVAPQPVVEREPGDDTGHEL